MTPSSQNEVTQPLLAWSDGDKAALEELSPQLNRGGKDEA